MRPKKLLATGLAAAMSLSAFPSPMPVGAQGVAAASYTSQPNIVMILLDDTGAREFSCYGNTFNETPYIDSVAQSGMKFNHFYTQPVCSPSRGCLMTGNNTLRNGVTNFLQENHPAYLDPEEFTVMPELMSSAGYHTGIIGKWHLCAGTDWDTSAGSVYNFGWDEALMCEQKSIGYGDYYYPYTHIPQVTGLEDGEYLVDAMYDEAVSFIERNQDEPFFLYLSHYATHITLDAPEETVEYFQQKRGTTANRETNDRNPYLAAMLKHLDDGVAAIDKQLEDLGLKENTILIIASDNGGETRITSNGELRGGKRQLYEGGITSPLIIRWPEAMKTGSVIETPVSMIDFYSTFAEAAGIPPDEIPENSGVSLMPILTGSGELDRDTLYWIYPRNTGYNPGDNFTNAEFHEGGAIRKGNFKYLESFAFPDRRELYDLNSDPSEQNNLIEEYPELYRQLARELHENLEKDTIGKVFTATFANKENYRYNSIGNISRADGTYKASGNGISIVTVEDYWYYDTQSEVEVTVDSGGRAGIVLRSNLAAPTNDAYTSYAVTISAASGLVEILNVRGDDVYPVALAKADIKANTMYKLKVVADSYNIKVYLNDKFVLECDDESYFKGSLGLYSEGSTSTFDNLTVTGIEGANPVTDRQLGFETEDVTKVMYNDLYIYFDEAPTEIDGELFVQAEKIADAISGEAVLDGNSITLSYYGHEAVYIEGSTAGKVNGHDVTWSKAPFMQNGKLMVALTDLCNGLALKATTKDDIILLELEFEREIKASDATLSGAWTSSGTSRYSTQKGASAEIVFSGTEIALYTNRSNDSGMFEVYLDGTLMAIIDGYGQGGEAVSYSVDGLDSGAHTLKLVNRGEAGQGSGTKLSVSRVVVTTRGSTLPETIATQSELILDTDDRLNYVGTWTKRDSGGAYGGTVTRSTTKDASCELSFNGYGVRLYLGRGVSCAVLEVYIDGELAATIDGYSAVGVQKSLVFEDLSLKDGEHTIKVVNTGVKGEGSNGTNLNIDAFEVFSYGEAVSNELILNTDSKIIYNGNWNKVVFANAYGGTVTRSTAKNASCELSFDGYGIRLFLGRGPVCGIFEIYLDGELVETIDGYQKDTAQQLLVYENTSLESGIHTIRVVNSGTRSNSSTGTNLNIDAFEVLNREAIVSDEEVARAISLIKYLPVAANIVEGHRSTVDAVNAVYSALTDEQKAEVSNYSRLEAINTALNTPDTPDVMKGDVNGDGEINSTDFTQVRRHFLGTFTIAEEHLDAADVDSDGQINGTDFMRIRRHFLGLFEINA